MIAFQWDPRFSTVKERPLHAPSASPRQRVSSPRMASTNAPASSSVLMPGTRDIGSSVSSGNETVSSLSANSRAPAGAGMWGTSASPSGEVIMPAARILCGTTSGHCRRTSATASWKAERSRPGCPSRAVSRTPAMASARAMARPPAINQTLRLVVPASTAMKFPRIMALAGDKDYPEADPKPRRNFPGPGESRGSHSRSDRATRPSSAVNFAAQSCPGHSPPAMEALRWR